MQKIRRFVVADNVTMLSIRAQRLTTAATGGTGGKGEKGKSTLKVCGPKIQVESSAVAWVMELIDCFGQARHVAGCEVKTRAHYNP